MTDIRSYWRRWKAAKRMVDRLEQVDEDVPKYYGKKFVREAARRDILAARWFIAVWLIISRFCFLPWKYFPTSHVPRSSARFVSIYDHTWMINI